MNKSQKHTITAINSNYDEICLFLNQIFRIKQNGTSSMDNELLSNDPLLGSNIVQSISK